ncbi:MAG TPA: 6-phosphogluconolactonase [Methylophilaceae bacterium]|nr:6-phosphogluconolactonase [Methylophilaceae bacterium]
MQTQIIRWKHYASISSLWHTACDDIVQCAAQAIAERGQFLIVLAGGNTPRAVYRLLREAQTDWSKWHIYYGDERCLPRGHADRNSLMVEQTWLGYVPIPASQIHTMPAESGTVLGAKAYAETLAGVGDFDFVLLGLGEDGHTASLFPGEPWNDKNGDGATVAVTNAPKPPPERISISASRLSAARRVLFLVNGAGKQQAVDDWLAGKAIPASAIKPKYGVDVYCYGVKVAA